MNIDDLASKVRNSHIEWDRERINTKQQIESLSSLGIIDPFGVETNLEKAIETI